MADYCTPLLHAWLILAIKLSKCRTKSKLPVRVAMIHVQSLQTKMSHSTDMAVAMLHGENYFKEKPQFLYLHSE